MKNILVTGGAGFIGSNFIKYIFEKYNDKRIINIDLLTYAGNTINLKEFSNNSNYIFVHGDIRSKDIVNKVFDEYNIDIVVNFAAESHVDKSIENSEDFISTNIYGTKVLLDSAKEHWNNTADKKFIQISTDEVYGSLEYNEPSFTEDSPLGPNNPYSASKAGAEMLVRAYYKTYGLPMNITRSSNNFGPYQYPEKLIPRMINRCIKNLKLPVYGNGLQIRDWIHVLDNCKAIDTVINKGKNGEIYNIGANNEIKNIDLVKMIIHYLNKPESLITFSKDRLGHDKRYSINNTKIISALGWKPCILFEEGFIDTIQWYVDNKDLYMNFII